MAITSTDIQNFLAANPGMTDAQIAAAMQTYGVTPAQMAQATTMPIADVQSRFDVANQQNITQQIHTLVSDIYAKGGNEFDVAREANKLNLSTKDLATALKMPEQEISKLSGGALNGVPARPTFSGVAAEWNKLHEAQFGTPLNLARAASEDIQRQIADLQVETQRQQAAWDKKYGDTPESKAIQKEAPPDWRQFFEPYSRASVERFGSTIDRPWSSDEGAINQKRILDDQYIKAVQDYNKKYGTNIAPDPFVLGTFAQPNEIVKAVEKDKWYEDPLNIAALAAAAYFGAPYLAQAFGGTGAAGAGAAGAGSAAGSAIVPSAFDAAVTSALGGGSTLGSAGAVGTAGFGSALPTAATTAANLAGAGLSAGTAANLAGATAAGTGATNLLGGATALAPVAASALPVALPSGVEIIDRSIPFDPKAYDAISTGQGLSSLANAIGETLTQNPLQTLRTANTIKNLYDGLTNENIPTSQTNRGIVLQNPFVANSSTTGALPGTLEAQVLEAAPVTTTPPSPMNLLQLKQLYPQLSTVDPKLLQILTNKAASATPSYYTYGAGSESPTGERTALSLTPSGGLPTAGYPAIAADRDMARSRLVGEIPDYMPTNPLSKSGLSMLAGRSPYGFAAGGQSHNPEFITGKTGHYVEGRGDGQSDEIPAMLADGEYVFDADTVAALGNGSNKAGAKVLDQMRQNIRDHKRSAPNSKIPPKAKSPLAYMKG